jgi:cytochrome P450
MYLTSVHPEAAERIIREGEEVYGDREPNAEDYSAMIYTRSVIQETMRIYPPVWGLIRVAAEDDEIGGKEIKKGDRIVLFSYGAHHDERFWDNPEEFDPERWMGSSGKKRVKFSFMPFGGGKRTCIGGAMSQVENTLALSKLLRRFRPEYVGQEPPGINATVTLTPKGGLHFKVHER